MAFWTSLDAQASSAKPGEWQTHTSYAKVYGCFLLLATGDSFLHVLLLEKAMDTGNSFLK
jgi:hypothetical protein